MKSTAFLLLPMALSAQIPPITGTPQTLATMRYIDIQVGSGAPATAGKRFTVHYTGWLREGKQFDSSRQRQPLSFVQGRRQVISGWEIGFEGMKVGGKRRLIIPYQLGYGELGSGATIPPGAELTFDVELLDVTDPPDVPPGIDVLAPYEELEQRTMSLANVAQFEGRVADSLRLIATLNAIMLDTAVYDLTDDQRKTRFETAMKSTPQNKEQMIAALTSSFAAVKKQLSSARAGFFTADITFMGRPNVRRGIFVELNVRIADLLRFAGAREPAI
jgi:hypothetical protein